MKNPLAGLVRGLALLTLLPAVGCGGGGFAEVEGTVTLNGKPLENVMVEFVPDPDKGTTGPRSTGVTDAQGRFTLKRDNQQSGAAIGYHRVILRDLKVYGEVYKPARQREDEQERDKNNPKYKPRFAARYSDLKTTPFQEQVTAEKRTVTLAITTP
ncbi:MAG: DUF4198 domain-containing protein [Gemmataceae bacterium]|nr:DUF4198 domain-containing protein [Gemmataceae bacterium]